MREHYNHLRRRDSTCTFAVWAHVTQAFHSHAWYVSRNDFLFQAMAAQDAAEKLQEEASAIGQNMAVTWEDDARACEVKYHSHDMRVNT